MFNRMNKKQNSIIAIIALFVIVMLTVSLSSAMFIERNEFLLKLAMAEHSTFGVGEDQSDTETPTEPHVDPDVLPEPEPDPESDSTIILDNG